MLKRLEERLRQSGLPFVKDNPRLTIGALIIFAGCLLAAFSESELIALINLIGVLMFFAGLTLVSMSMLSHGEDIDDGHFDEDEDPYRMGGQWEP